MMALHATKNWGKPTGTAQKGIRPRRTRKNPMGKLEHPNNPSLLHSCSSITDLSKRGDEGVKKRVFWKPTG